MLKRKPHEENKENDHNYQSPRKTRRANEEKSILGGNFSQADLRTSSGQQKEIKKIQINEDAVVKENEKHQIKITLSNNINLTSSEKNLHQKTNDDQIENVKLFKKILKNTIKSGDFSVSGEAAELPTQLGLHVKDVGIISTPLTDFTVNQLIKISSQAPYGLNEKTLIDKNVRDSYQIQPDQIEIKNPEWNKKLNGLVQQVAKSLGCLNKNVTAKLYKMLLYEKGGHFKKHRDTEKEKNMFATLVIQLPSIYEGGKFNVYHNGKKKTYDFGQSTEKAPYSMHFTAHYADLEHELLEIKSGYRLVLVYSLCSSDDELFCLSNAEGSNKMSELLIKMNQMTKPLAILLEHQYTQESLSKNGCKALKGLDMDHFNLLKTASDILDEDDKLCFYIVNANLVLSKWDLWDEYHKNSVIEKNLRKLRKEKHDYTLSQDEVIDSDDCVHDYDESKVTKSRFIGSGWYDSNGNNFKFNPDRSNPCVSMRFFSNIIDPNTDLPYDDWIKNYNFTDAQVEYTGNEGSTQTTKYGRYMLTFWSKKQEFSILAKISTKKATDDLRESLDKIKTKHGEFIENLKHLLNGLNSNLCYSYFEPDEVYGKICEMLHALKEEDLYKLFFYKLNEEKASLSMDTLNDLWTNHDLNKNLFKPLILKYLKRFSNNDNLLKIIQELNDLDVTRIYIEHLIINCNRSYSLDQKGFQSAITMYKSNLKLSEIELFLDNELDVVYVKKNCEVACALKLKDSKLASDFLKNKILRLVESQDNFKLLIRIIKMKESCYFYSLTETLLLFEKENELIKLKDLILNNFDSDSLTRILKEFADQKRPNFKLFNSSKPILDMFIYQCKWFEEKLKTFKFETAMPDAYMWGHSDVEAFLKSDLAELVYNGSDTNRKFLTKSDAESFIRYKNGFHASYSIDCSLMKQPGSNTRYLIKIVKTNKLYESQVNTLKQDNDILKSFVLTFVKNKYNR